MASLPSEEFSPPIKTRSACCKSSTAVPSAKNSGFERTWNFTPPQALENLSLTTSAVRIGRVDFFTTILTVSDAAAICLAHSSIHFRSAACIFPSR